MLALEKPQQAFFLGVRSTCYRVAMVFGSGVLVVLAGTLAKTKSPALGWSVAMAVPALLMGCLFLFHRAYLPFPAADSPCPSSSKLGNFREAFRSYFRQDRIIPIVGFILVYRLGEAMLLKMVAPFLLDGAEAGGLGLATDTVGYVYGTVGVVSMSAGGILGGVLIARFGLKKCIWPLTIILHGPDAAFVYLSSVRPELFMVSVMVAIEQFGYGMGFTAFGVFLMHIARGPYKTSHFAISTSLMALGMMLPGMLSGMLQQALGYTGFFIAVLVLTVPGMVLLLFIPLEGRQPSSESTRQG
jgi:PAT family beta-lactamase induction signal transducer AmpG